MPETFRPPKAVLAEGIVSGPLLAVDDVWGLRDAGGETGAWASRLARSLEARAVSVLPKEFVMTVTETRAMPADQPTADALAALLPAVFDVYARAHEAHWNVTGDDFTEYHQLFGAIYEDVYGSIDPIAENIRKLGSLTPSLTLQARSLPGVDPMTLAADLLTANEAVCEQIRAAFDVATAAGQQGIANFLAERQDQHQFWCWQLRSSLGIAEVGEEPVEEPVEEPGEVEVPRSELMLAEMRKALANAERITVDAEVRAASDGSMRIAGYAAMFMREASGLPFREQIAPGAFRRSLQSGEPVYLLVNHDTDQLPLASTRSGTLSLSEDETGLYMEATLDPTNPRAAELHSALVRGDVDKMSFAFSINPGGESRDGGVRTLTDVTLYEVSVVTWPAYDATEVSARTAADEELALRARHLKAQLEFINRRK